MSEAAVTECRCPGCGRPIGTLSPDGECLLVDTLRLRGVFRWTCRNCGRSGTWKPYPGRRPAPKPCPGGEPCQAPLPDSGAV